MDRLLTTSEAAKILKAPVRTVRGWAAKGLLPAVQIDGVRDWLFEESAVRAFARPKMGRPRGETRPARGRRA